MRVMIRALLAVFVLWGVGCDKPTEDDCKKAYVNMRKVAGAPKGADEEREIKSFVRQCRSQYKGEAVKCVANATDQAAVNKCLGIKEPAVPPVPPG
jgi:hypothetical protein